MTQIKFLLNCNVKLKRENFHDISENLPKDMAIVLLSILCKKNSDISLPS